MVAIFPASSNEGGMALVWPDTCWVPFVPFDGPVPMDSLSTTSSTKKTQSKVKIEKKYDVKKKSSSTMPHKSETVAFKKFDASPSMIGSGIISRKSQFGEAKDDDFGYEGDWPRGRSSGIIQDEESGMDDEWFDDPYNRDSDLNLLAMQHNVYTESRKFQILTQASKARHDVAMKSVRNIRA
jgi:hypothetical protein